MDSVPQHPSVIDTYLLDGELQRFAGLGYLRLERIEGHRCYFVTDAGELAFSRAKEIAEGVGVPANTKAGCTNG